MPMQNANHIHFILLRCHYKCTDFSINSIQFGRKIWLEFVSHTMKSHKILDHNIFWGRHNSIIIYYYLYYSWISCAFYGPPTHKHIPQNYVIIFACKSFNWNQSVEFAVFHANGENLINFAYVPLFNVHHLPSGVMSYFIASAKFESILFRFPKNLLALLAFPCKRIWLW